MIFFQIVLLFLTMISKLLIAASEERCISEYFVQNGDSVYTCDFHDINAIVDNDLKCVHFLGLPDIRMCGEMGLRYKLTSKSDHFLVKNSSISLRYFFNKSREVEYENINIDDKYVWNHWSKVICADLTNGISMYVQSSIITLDRMLLFIHTQDNRNESYVLMNHNTCKDDNKRPDPEVQYFGWKVTAIILMIVTVGSLILVVSLSVTMPYNVWDKPKIQMLPVRLTDGVLTSN